ncbi:MAG TPA: alkaline phosphatase family protein [Thermoanaerobaculia bacterium]|jgi:hypothetical protein
MRLRVAAALLIFASSLPLFAAPFKTKNVVVIVTDGLRWQEVFRGAETALVSTKPGGVEDEPATKKAFWRESAAERRVLLLPFFWTVIAKEGQLYGNRDAGSIAQVENGYKFSYPGYNEIVTGTPDPRIDKNEFGRNPNVSVFEWLNGLPELRGRAGVVGGWDVFNDIFNRERSGLDMRVAYETPFPGAIGPGSREELVNKLYRTVTREFSDMPWDGLLQETLLGYVAAKKPRLLFVGYGETDEWAHNGRYDLVLQTAHNVDAYVRELWTAMQAMPEYKDQTTFLITTDHGRGDGPENWKHHDWNVEGAENMWIAVLGPDTPPLGERKNAPRVTQGQIAATAAALLGKDWRAQNPKAAPPLAEAIGAAK